MKHEPLIVPPENRNVALSVAGTDVTVLVSGEQSETQQLTLQSGREGSGPPPHSHPWDESFYITSGLVQFTYDGKTSLCRPGTLVHVPAGTIHSFSYGEGGGEMLEVTGGASKSVESFIALDREASSGTVDIPKTIEIAGAYGVKFYL
jgi:quercetin dioxygenase-like cupin family protein